MGRGASRSLLFLPLRRWDEADENRLSALCANKLVIAGERGLALGEGATGDAPRARRTFRWRRTHPQGARHTADARSRATEAVRAFIDSALAPVSAPLSLGESNRARCLSPSAEARYERRCERDGRSTDGGRSNGRRGTRLTTCSRDRRRQCAMASTPRSSRRRRASVRRVNRRGPGSAEVQQATNRTRDGRHDCGGGIHG